MDYLQINILIWMVPYGLPTDAQIINKLSVETLLTTIDG